MGSQPCSLDGCTSESGGLCQDSGCSFDVVPRDSHKIYSQSDAMARACGGDPVAEQAPKSAPPRGYDIVASPREDMSSYHGQRVDGLRHGFGVWKDRNVEYAGQWKNDQQDGFGHQVWAGRRHYQGQFYNGKLCGSGRMIYTSPQGDQTYEGEFLDDKKHGVGTFSWADGRSYAGEWFDGKRHGQGAYTNSSKQKRVGLWEGDSFLGWAD